MSNDIRNQDKEGFEHEAESETGPDTQFEIHLTTTQPEPKEGIEPEDAKLLGELQTETPLEQTENVQNADSEAEIQEGSNPPLKSKNEDSNGEERVGNIRTRSPDYFHESSTPPAWCVIHWKLEVLF